VPLYHYCSPEGLVGIVKSRSSGIHYMNDTAEFKHAASLISSLLNQHLKDENDAWKELYRTLLENLPSYTDHMIFVASFSEAKDTLSMWRAYCSAGSGFSIGFDSRVVENQAKLQDFKLLKCEYDPEKQKAICEAMISDACQEAQEVEGRGRESALNYSFFLSFMSAAPALKNPSFQEEREWRVVRGPFLRKHDIYAPETDLEGNPLNLGWLQKRDNLHFRASKYAVIPYLDFALADDDGPLDVEQIIVGPNPDTRQAKKSIEYFLKNHSVRCKSIAEYSGTYRNW
jgi:hypothetical protein